MHHITVVAGLLLSAIGLFGYFGSVDPNPSPTALIPAAFGIVLIVLGILAHRQGARKHAMHAAAAIALLGAVMAGGRVAMKLGDTVSDDLTLSRPLRLSFLMAIVCLVYVVLCVNSFIAARRRRAASGD